MTESGPRGRWNPVAVSLARRTFGLMVFVLGLTTLNTRACAVVASQAPVTGPWHRQISVAGMGLDIVVVFTDAGGSEISGAQPNIDALRAASAQGGNGDVTVRAYERANHLFLPATTGMPSEYAALEKTFVPGLLDDIFDWLPARVAK